MEMVSTMDGRNFTAPIVQPDTDGDGLLDGQEHNWWLSGDIRFNAFAPIERTPTLTVCLTELKAKTSNPLRA